MTLKLLVTVISYLSTKTRLTAYDVVHKLAGVLKTMMGNISKSYFWS